MIFSNNTPQPIPAETDPIYTADKPNIANLSGADFTGNISALNLSGTNTGDETNESIKTKLGTDLTNKALDSAVVHNSGNETVAGVKNFTENQTGANISKLNVGTCTTAQATVAKEATLVGYVPSNGDKVSVLMTNASVANATIRFNGTGTVYAIRNATTVASASSWAANSVCEFLLDGTNAFILSTKPMGGNTQPTLYVQASSASTAGSATYSTGGILGTNTLSDTNKNIDKWAYWGDVTFTYNATYNNHSINQWVLFKEQSRLNSYVADGNYENFTAQIKMSLNPTTTSSADFNSAIPTMSIDIDGKTNLTSADFCALVYSTSTSSKVVRLYVKLKTANKHYSFLSICYGNNAYASTGAISQGYNAFAVRATQALIYSLPTPAQGSITYANILGAWANMKLTATQTTDLNEGDRVKFDKGQTRGLSKITYGVVIPIGRTFEVAWCVVAASETDEFELQTALWDNKAGTYIDMFDSDRIAQQHIKGKDGNYCTVGHTVISTSTEIELQVAIYKVVGLIDRILPDFSYLVIKEL